MSDADGPDIPPSAPATVSATAAPITAPWQDTPELIAAQRRIRRTLLLAQVLGGIGIGAGVSMG